MTMTTTTVVNIKGRQKEAGAFEVYIGDHCFRGGWRLEGSKWANPYKVDTPDRKRDGTREEVIAKYHASLLGNAKLLAALPDLRGKVLGCWCKPLPCHGDVLVALADAAELVRQAQRSR